MNPQSSRPQYDDESEVTVKGFEVPSSPDSSYNNFYPMNEDDDKEPPRLPLHLQKSLLEDQEVEGQSEVVLSDPEHLNVNHLYTDINSRKMPADLVAQSTTQQFRSKFVTVVLYKPSPRRDISKGRGNAASEM